MGSGNLVICSRWGYGEAQQAAVFAWVGDASVSITLGLGAGILTTLAVNHNANKHFKP